MTRTLHVRVDSDPDHSDLEGTFEAIDGGEDVPARESVLTVDDVETLGRIFRPTNLELLQAIVQHEPESIRELARTVDRNPPEVLDNIDELETYGLVELQQNGRSKRPLLWYDDIDIDIPLGQRRPDGDASVVESD